ncbi:MAG: energy transducer TonB, partial [Nitrospinaceae bacterium]|nr:energy transducer TonB [Nitrospinaceae bacterium]NIU46053.1 energy transducer TonB [Nitrospinaceae bacterium]NIU98217.1 energy transducer TonB [Nitrospinaceae bacterium]NIW60787.1 energy transducer TonB [Nitrospinaceae bacterium]
MQATGTSGGISASAISTTVGTGEEGGSGEQIGSVDFSRVESSVASAEEQVERPSVSSPAPARTDEEIQIV